MGKRAKLEKTKVNCRTLDYSFKSFLLVNSSNAPGSISFPYLLYELSLARSCRNTVPGGIIRILKCLPRSSFLFAPAAAIHGTIPIQPPTRKRIFSIAPLQSAQSIWIRCNLIVPTKFLFTAQIYEPPLQYHYLKRPYQLIPSAAAEMPVTQYFDKNGVTFARRCGCGENRSYDL